MEEKSHSSSLKVIFILHWAITIIPLFFGGFVLYTNLTGPVGELTRENQIFMYLPGIALIIAFPGSQVLFKNHL
ncbi:MAG: hypothetical protein OEU76_08340, partial [Cyclobacteriaceae bacterium]|nr:hypothetical protein [Cyclobacteriaceae bacterium]